MALIRYPGSKAKLADEILAYFPDEMRMSLWHHNNPMEYREPFFGSGEIGFRLIFRVLDFRARVWINDIDPGIASLWRAVAEKPTLLCQKISRFKPSVDAFFEFKSNDGTSSGDFVDDGFRKLALHRMSVSGFGVMSGGPIGGKSQVSSEYNVSCRWTPSRMKRDVAQIHRRMKRFSELRITCLDFRELLKDTTDNTFIYLDPPYYEKGSQLYKHNMGQRDHEELARVLQSINCRWALSYDDHNEIRRLYGWAEFNNIAVKYSNAVFRGVTRPKNKEVVIVPKAA